MMFPKGKYKRARKARGRAACNESHLQQQCEDYLDMRLLTYIRIPDSLYRYIFGGGSMLPVHVKKLISSMIKGVPDLTILHRDGRYICVELKTETGKLSLGQKQWSRGVGDNYHVIRSFDAFKTLIDDWSKE